MTNVRDFGAEGDGRTDDTDAIQRALDEGDGLIWLDRGDYVISRPLVVELAEAGRLGINGGGGTATLVMTGPGPALDLVGTHGGTAGPDSFKPGVWKLERMPTVSQLEIVGAHDEADGIRLTMTHAAIISQVHIRECRHGVHLVKRDRNAIITDCHIHNNRGVGVFYDGVNIHQSNITGSHISYNKAGGIKILDAQIRNIQITGNDIEYNYDLEAEESADVWFECVGDTIREGAITGNTIQASPSPGGANVRIRGARMEHPTAAGLLTIAGNLISSQETNLHIADSRGIVVAGNQFFSGHEHTMLIERSEYINLSGNNIGHNPDYKADTIDGIVLSDCNGCSLTGTIIESTRAGSEQQGGAIDVRRSTAINIVGCQVHDPLHRAFYLEDVQGSRVSDCIVAQSERDNTMQEAVRLEGGCDAVQMADNLFEPGRNGTVVGAGAI